MIHMFIDLHDFPLFFLLSCTMILTVRIYTAEFPIFASLAVYKEVAILGRGKSVKIIVDIMNAFISFGYRLRRYNGINGSKCITEDIGITFVDLYRGEQIGHCAAKTVPGGQDPVFISFFHKVRQVLLDFFIEGIHNAVYLVTKILGIRFADGILFQFLICAGPSGV